MTTFELQYSHPHDTWSALGCTEFLPNRPAYNVWHKMPCRINGEFAKKEPTLLLELTAALVTTFTAGQDIDFQFSYTNNSAEDIDNILSTIDHSNGSLSDITLLAIGATDSTTVFGVYTITSADVTAGFVTFIASGAGDFALSGGPISSNSASLTVV
jgi:hypothetical protein